MRPAGSNENLGIAMINRTGRPLRENVKAMADWLIQVRRAIHQNPELSFEEVETSELVCRWLFDFGIEVRKGLAKTGVVGLIQGREQGRTIAIRADMDALPLSEANQLPYASRREGKMHACGHDAHTAILLGVARLFSTLRDSVKGNIKFIFQPAEEVGQGAKTMVEEGVLENPEPDAIFGYHVFPFVETGKVGIYMREAFAAVDKFTITIMGKGGHAAYPHVSRDPILAAGHFISQIHSIVSRDINPKDRAVVTVGMVKGGTAFNIIPAEVEIVGTIRSFDLQVREGIRRRIKEVCRGIAVSFKVDYRFECDGHPAVINDPEMSRLVVRACSKGVGEENVEILEPNMGGEDFAYYLEKCRGSFFRLGIRNEGKGIVHPLHSNAFDIDESVLPFGVEVVARIVDEYLGLQLFRP